VDRTARSSVPSRGGIFLFATASRSVLGPTQSPLHWNLGAVVKMPGCEADRSPPCSADVKNAWSYTSTLSYVFTTKLRVRLHGVVLS
jgi:hypothetical protein